MIHASKINNPSQHNTIHIYKRTKTTHDNTTPTQTHTYYIYKRNNSNHIKTENTTHVRTQNIINMKQTTILYIYSYKIVKQQNKHTLYTSTHPNSKQVTRIRSKHILYTPTHTKHSNLNILYSQTKITINQRPA